MTGKKILKKKIAKNNWSITSRTLLKLEGEFLKQFHKSMVIGT